MINKDQDKFKLLPIPSHAEIIDIEKIKRESSLTLQQKIQDDEQIKEL
jgi:hypothetical protein